MINPKEPYWRGEIHAFL